MTMPATSRPPRHHVEHGELLGHAQRRVVQRQGVADDGDLAALGPLRQGRGDEVGRRHQAVGVLVVLVDADAVEAQLVGVGQGVDVFVVELVALDRVVEACWAARPRRSRTSGRSRPAGRARTSGGRSSIARDGLPGDTAVLLMSVAVYRLGTRRPRAASQGGEKSLLFQGVRTDVIEVRAAHRPPFAGEPPPPRSGPCWRAPSRPPAGNTPSASASSIRRRDRQRAAACRPPSAASGRPR